MQVTDQKHRADGTMRIQFTQLINNIPIFVDSRMYVDDQGNVLKHSTYLYDSEQAPVPNVTNAQAIELAKVRVAEIAGVDRDSLIFGSIDASKANPPLWGTATVSYRPVKWKAKGEASLRLVWAVALFLIEPDFASQIYYFNIDALDGEVTN